MEGMERILTRFRLAESEGWREECVIVLEEADGRYGGWQWKMGKVESIHNVAGGNLAAFIDATVAVLRVVCDKRTFEGHLPFSFLT